jgi:hypothetical protein
MRGIESHYLKVAKEKTATVGGLPMSRVNARSGQVVSLTCLERQGVLPSTRGRLFELATFMDEYHRTQAPSFLNACQR